MCHIPKKPTSLIQNQMSVFMAVSQTQDLSDIILSVFKVTSSSVCEAEQPGRGERAPLMSPPLLVVCPGSS